MHPDLSRSFMRLPQITLSSTHLLHANESSFLPNTPPVSTQAQIPLSLPASPALESEEMAHIITELQSPAVNEERRRVLLKLVGIEDQSCGCADALDRNQSNWDLHLLVE